MLDDYTVKVSFTGPNAQFLQASSTTTLSILSPSTYQKTAAQRAAGDVIGSGLFVLDSFKAGQEVKLSRRKDYAWPSKLVKNQGEAYLDGISVSYIAEDSVRLGNLTSGELDIDWPRLPISSADQALIKQAGGTIISRSLPGIADILLPNATGGRPFSDPRVRAGGQQGDRPQELRVHRVLGHLPRRDQRPGQAARRTTGRTSRACWRYDPSGAKALLDAAGWKTGAGGFRYKDGKQLTLTYLVSINSDGPQLLQSQLKQVGINVEIKVLTTGQLLAIEKSGDYDMTESYLTRGDPSVLGSILNTEFVKSPPGTNTQSAGPGGHGYRLLHPGAVHREHRRPLGGLRGPAEVRHRAAHRVPHLRAGPGVGPVVQGERVRLDQRVVPAGQRYLAVRLTGNGARSCSGTWPAGCCRPSSSCGPPTRSPSSSSTCCPATRSRCGWPARTSR